MYFVRYQLLKQKLRSRVLPDREALPYLLAYITMTAIGCYLPMIGEYNFWDGALGILVIIISIGGTLYAYQKNGGHEGHDFIQKFVVLGWIVSVRFLLIVLPTAVVLIGLGILIGLTPMDETGPYDVAVFVVAMVIFWQRLGKHIGDTSAKIDEGSDGLDEPSRFGEP